MGRREDLFGAAKRAADKAKSSVDRGSDLAGEAIRRGGDLAGGAIVGGRDAIDATVQSTRELGHAALDRGATAVSAAAGTGSAVAANLAATVATVVPERLLLLGSPEFPLQSTWGVSFSQFLSGIAGVPAPLAPMLARLDSVGSMSVSPMNLEFDGESVEWRQVQEITLGSPIDAVSSRAAIDLVNRIRTLLPPFPGRAMLVRQAVELLIALCLAVVPSTQGSGEHDDVQVVKSIRYAGRLRRKEIRPGFFALLLSAAKPDVATVIVETSRPLGVVVTVEPPGRAVTRAAALRDLAAKLRQQIATDTDDTLDGRHAEGTFIELPQPPTKEARAEDESDRLI